MGLPAELAVLPHVESSFNPAAYSKVGAAGLWQFMRSTGRRYLHIDNTVDDRLDPFRSTQAAAQLLAYNYHLLGTWPLALTAYNHGAEGVRRAKEILGTDDIVSIVRNYKGRTFGFASRNFYVSFLAALEIDHNPEKYFANIEPNPEMKFQEVVLPAYVQLSALEHTLKIGEQRLQALNPALLPAVWNGQRHVPKGYRLRLPMDGEKWTTELLAARLPARELYAAQLEPRRYRVQRAESLGLIAARYNVSTAELAQLNGISPSAKLRPGRSLRRAKRDAESGGNHRRHRIQARPHQALTASARPPLRCGQRYRRQLGPRPPAAAGSRSADSADEGRGSDACARLPLRPRLTIRSGVVTVEVAQLESEEDAEQVAKVGRPAARAEPVSAAQAEALSPALGPGVEVR